MQISKQGIDFIARHEGFVGHAYSDAVGVLTIGYGFTMRSGVFSRYWQSAKGRALQAGDTISRPEANQLLQMLLDQEYTTGIDRLAKPTTQWQFDACASVSYNAGPGSLNDSWAHALSVGNVQELANLLRGYKLTHGILVGRRRDEANLLENGDYGAPVNNDVVVQYQEKLEKLGFYKGALDGIIGPLTRGAISAFQTAHNLPATGMMTPDTETALGISSTAPVAVPAAPPAHTSPITPTHVAGVATAAAAAGAVVHAASSSSITGNTNMTLYVVVAIAVIGILAYLFRAKILAKLSPSPVKPVAAPVIVVKPPASVVAPLQPASPPDPKV